jgi:hypothetical protein
LEGNPLDWNVLARHETHTLTLAEFLTQAGKDVATFNDFGALQTKLESRRWDCCQLNASFQAEGGSSDFYFEFDLSLGEALQHLSDDTVILVIGDGCFVLVSSNNPISGYLNGSTLDLVPTLLELAGYPLPASTEGRSWVAGLELSNTSGLTEDEQALLRERLSGLGYV